jgi:hypothetical protein
MSAYVVDNKTISAIVDGIINYNVDYRADNYEAPVQVIIDLQELRNAIGQSLFDQNFDSVNYCYGGHTVAPRFEYERVEVNPGIILGCVQCYEYQAGETKHYFESVLHFSLQDLVNKMLERYIEKDGFEIPWGYEE